MKSVLRAGVVLAVAALTGLGCGWMQAYRAPVVPPRGSGFSTTRVPMNLRFRATKLGSKKGSATSSTVLGLVSWGDSSTATAARNGNISTITHADSEFFNLLTLYGYHRTIVYGD